jgi:tripartite-type tricarboxylate transporter receptor subunit TctC
MKRHIGLVVAVVAFLCVIGPVQGQSVFPSRPVTVVVGLAPGGPADLSTRALVKVATKYLGQSIVVMNKPGAGGVIGTAAIAAANPDGYTLGTLMTSALMTAPHVEKVSYNPVTDIEPIIQYGIFLFAASVRADSPFNTFKDLVAYARKNPQALTYGTVGAAAAQQVILEQIARQEKVQWTNVPYRGGAELQLALMSGQIMLVAGDFMPAMVETKKQRLLAMFLNERSPEYPDVPTLSELGYSVPFPYFMGIGAPKGMPEPVIRRLEDAFTKAYNDPEFTDAMKSLRIPAYYRNRTDFGHYIAENYLQMGRSIEQQKKKE